MTTPLPVASALSGKSATAKAPDIATVSVSDTLATLHANPDTGLTLAEVETRRTESTVRIGIYPSPATSGSDPHDE
jgi:hypothetical protein